MNLRQHILGINMAHEALKDSEIALSSECEGALSPWISHPSIGPLWLELQRRMPECRRTLQCSIRLLERLAEVKKKGLNEGVLSPFIAFATQLEDIRVNYLRLGTEMDHLWDRLIVEVNILQNED